MTARQRISAPKKRTGCFACKDAHVQCTEERPSCKRCLRIDLCCTYGKKLTWREDALSRNIAHGRTGVWSRKPRTGIDSAQRFVPFSQFNQLPATQKNEPVQYTFRNLTVEDFAFRNDTGNDTEIDDSKLTDAEPRPTITGHDLTEDAVEIGCLPAFPQRAITSHIFGGVESYLLNYFIHELGPKCSLSTKNNPYIHVLVPIAMKYQPLRDALLAASANSLRLQDDARYETLALRHKSLAMRGLRRALDANIIDWRGLATTLMFCFYDISDGCEPSWIVHLNLGLKMLKQLGTTTKVDSDIRSFCEMYFVAHEVMGRTAWQAGTSENEDYAWAMNSLDEIDPLMGCSRELITLIGQISHLARWFAVARSDEMNQLEAAREHLSSRLHNLHQSVAPGTQNVHYLTLIAEGKRLSALLHLEERIPRSSHAISAAGLIIPAILDVLRALPTSHAAMLWPLFIIGTSSASTHEQRAFVLDRLEQLQSSRRLGSIYHARRLVERRVSSRLTQQTIIQQDSTRMDDLAQTENERWVSLA